MFSKDFHLK